MDGPFSYRQLTCPKGQSIAKLMVTGPKNDLFIQAAEQVSRALHIPIQCTGTTDFGPLMHAGRFSLPNGCRLVLVPDPRAPIFCLQSWFAVGSKHEEPHRTGLAHLFEHLMFKGTKHHPPGEFDKEMERRGAQTNAATWVDWTYYTVALPAQQDNLACLLHYEADRMQHLLLEEDTFRSELEVVKNERRMSVDDHVTGLLSERLFQLAFQHHAYSWPTIGSMAHLESCSIPDLQQFYRRHYVPHKLCHVLVGDIDVTSALTLWAQHFAPIPQAAALPNPHAIPQEPRQTSPRQLAIAYPSHAPQLLIGYKTPAQAHPDSLALDVLADVLAGGESSRLYQSLVDEHTLAVDVQASLLPFADPGLLECHVMGRPGTDPQHILEQLELEIARLPQTLTQAELNKALHGLEMGLYEQLREVEGCAEALGHGEITQQRFDRAFHLLEQSQQITLEQVQAVAARYLVPSGRSAVWTQETPHAES